MFWFQSTLPRGERLSFEAYADDYALFQSTLPRGERHRGRFRTDFDESFNPRSHEGSDVQLIDPGHVLLRFQSTLPRGERLDPIYKVITGDEFQSTLPRGERQLEKQV